MNWMIPLTGTTLGAEEAEAAARVVRSGWVTMGEEVAAFESEFAAALGARHAIAVSSGTAALHLSYMAAGLDEGDEFCLPALTFVAAMNAGLTLRARPVLIDCASEDDLTMSPGDLERKITPRTRLIVSMPYGGHAPDMQRLLALAVSRGCTLVEDACHAPLAEISGRKIGTFGLAAAWSFFGNKNMTTGEGGMITTDDDAVAERVRRLRSHGMTTLTWDRHKGHASGYDVVEPGHNYRMDEMRAAVGRVQLHKLPAATERRRKISHLMREALAPCLERGLAIPFEHPRGTPAPHLFVALLPEGRDREAFRGALAARGIQTSVHYPPLHRFTAARGLFEDVQLPVVERVEKRLVTLPLGPDMTEGQIQLIAESVLAALR